MTMNDDAIDFEKVELVRKRMYLSMADMANLFGVSRTTYYNWLSDRPVRPRNKKRIRMVLRRIVPLLKDGSWPTDEARRQTTSSARVVELLKLLDTRA